MASLGLHVYWQWKSNVMDAEYDTQTSVMEQGYEYYCDDYNQYHSTEYSVDDYYTTYGVKRRAQSDWTSPYPKRLNNTQTNPYQTRMYGEHPRNMSEHVQKKPSKYIRPGIQRQLEKKRRQMDRDKVCKLLKPNEVYKLKSQTQDKKLDKTPLEKQTKSDSKKPYADKSISDKNTGNSHPNEPASKVPNGTVTAIQNKSKCADEKPSAFAKNRLDKACEMIMSSFWDQHAKDKYRIDTTRMPHINVFIKETIRERVDNLLLNKTVKTPEDICTLYRNNYPPETDKVLSSIVEGTKNVTFEQMSSLLVESDDPNQYFKTNMKTLLTVGLSNLFNNVTKLQLKNDVFQVREAKDKSKLSKTNNINSQSNKEMKDQKKKDVMLNSKEVFKLIEAQLPIMLPKYADLILNAVCEEEKFKATRAGILSKAKLLTNVLNNKDIIDKNENLQTNASEIEVNSSNIVLPQKITATSNTNKKGNFNLPNITTNIPTRKIPVADETICSRKNNLIEKTALPDEVNMEEQDKLIKDTIEVDERTCTNETRKSPINVDPSASNNQTIVIVPSQQLNNRDIKEAIDTIVSSLNNKKTAATTQCTAEIRNKSSFTTNKGNEKENNTVKDTVTSKHVNTGPQLKNNPTSTKTILSEKNDASTTKNNGVKPALLNTAYIEENTSTPSSIKEPYYAKIICHPEIPARSQMQKFLDLYNKTLVKKHKGVGNVLIIGFSNKEDCDKMLLANQTVIDKSTIFIRGYKQSNKEHAKSPKEPVTEGVNELLVTIKSEPKDVDQLDDILNKDLEDQITNLLLSIKQEQEEEYEASKD